MEFLGKGQIKKLPKSDPAKSKKKVASLNSSAYIKLMMTKNILSQVAQTPGSIMLIRWGYIMKYCHLKDL